MKKIFKYLLTSIGVAAAFYAITKLLDDTNDNFDFEDVHEDLENIEGFHEEYFTDSDLQDLNEEDLNKILNS